MGNSGDKDGLEKEGRNVGRVFWWKRNACANVKRNKYEYWNEDSQWKRDKDGKKLSFDINCIKNVNFVSYQKQLIANKPSKTQIYNDSNGKI